MVCFLFMRMRAASNPQADPARIGVDFRVVAWLIEMGTLDSTLELDTGAQVKPVRHPCQVAQYL